MSLQKSSLKRASGKVESFDYFLSEPQNGSTTRCEEPLFFPQDPFEVYTNFLDALQPSIKVQFEGVSKNPTRKIFTAAYSFWSNQKY